MCLGTGLTLNLLMSSSLILSNPPLPASAPTPTLLNTLRPTADPLNLSVCEILCASITSSNVLCTPNRSIISVLVHASNPIAALYILRIRALIFPFSVTRHFRYPATYAMWLIPKACTSLKTLSSFIPLLLLATLLTICIAAPTFLCNLSNITPLPLASCNHSPNTLSSLTLGIIPPFALNSTSCHLLLLGPTTTYADFS
ncbi:hypothetical protein ISCGN_012524 [Ixodes scapularis]